MSRIIRSLFVLVIVLASFPLTTTTAEPLPLPPGCVPGISPNNAQYIVCEPPNWNGELVVFAHGYVDPTLPNNWTDQLTFPDGTNLLQLITGMGYAFAASGYSKQGLAVTQGIADTAELVTMFKTVYPATQHVFLVGVSEGGLITALSLERLPQLYDGGVAACGPIGDFRKQINYFGDFRVLFDYFLPKILPGSAVSVPSDLYDGWYTTYSPLVAEALAKPKNQSRVVQLLDTSRAAYDILDKTTISKTVLGILDYNVRATEDAKLTLGGQPFGNTQRIYFGSNNDLKLNQRVQRYQADQAALEVMALNYQTSGSLTKPLVGLHTLYDPIVPFWHTVLYRMRTIYANSANMYLTIPVSRYGHCAFTANEALAAFAVMVYRATGELPDIGTTLADPTEYKRIVTEQTGK